MFCPKCNCEYREGFTTCSDCNVSLVDSLPNKQKKEKISHINEGTFIEYEYVTTISGTGEIALLKSILEGEGIKYYISGELTPKAPKELMVIKGEKEKVLDIMKVYNI